MSQYVLHDCGAIGNYEYWMLWFYCDFLKKFSVKYHNFVDFLAVIFLQAIAPPISQLDLQLQLADVYNN